MKLEAFLRLREGMSRAGGETGRSNNAVLYLSTGPWRQRDLGSNPSSTVRDLFILSDHSACLSIKWGEGGVERIIIITLQGCCKV